MKHIKTVEEIVPRNITVELTNEEINTIVFALGNISHSTLKQHITDNKVPVLIDSNHDRLWKALAELSDMKNIDYKI